MISTQFVRTSLIFLLAHVWAKHLRIYKTSCDLYLSVALDTLEFMLGEIVSSVEATLFVRVVNRSWQDGFHGQFATHTNSNDRERAILLGLGDDSVPVSADGTEGVSIPISVYLLIVILFTAANLTTQNWIYTIERTYL